MSNQHPSDNGQVDHKDLPTEIPTPSYLSPAQATAIAALLNWWADTALGPWLDGDVPEHLYSVEPLAYFDPRILMHVDDNAAFASLVQERCRAIAREVEDGKLPCDRDGCFFDEALIGAVFQALPDFIAGSPELFDVPEQSDSGAKRAVSPPPSESDWACLEDDFDDRSRWDDWAVPALHRQFVTMLLAQRHPMTWFDEVPAGRPRLSETIAAYFGETEEQYLARPNPMLTEIIRNVFPQAPDEQGDSV